MARLRVEGELRGFFRRAGLRRPARSAPENGVEIPEHIDWNVHRIASSQRYSSGLKEIEWEWSLEDVWDANQVLDLWDVAEKKAADEARRKAPK